MKTLLIERAGSALLSIIAEPIAGPGDVLLQIRTVGFCGSDLSTYRGANPLVSYPRVPGHEIGATILEIGTDVPVRMFAIGTDVTVVPYTACGSCAACRHERPNACKHNETLGVQRQGAMTERIAVPWQKIVRAEGLSLRELALVEPLSVGFHAVDRGRVTAGDTVVVLGCGAVGLGAIAGAHERGARVIAADVDDAKLALARAAGASDHINTSVGSLSDTVAGLTGGHGADVVIEAVGIAETFIAAIDIASFTGRVVYIGYAKTPVSYETSQFVKKELDILGSRNATAADFQAVIGMLRRGTFPSASAVTKTVSLDDSAEALREWSTAPARVTRIHVDIAPSPD